MRGQNMKDISYMEDLLNELSEINVSANVEARPETNGYWSYNIIAKNLADCLQFEEKAEGNITVCDCSNCYEYKREVLEIFSLCKALNWVKANEPETRVKVYVESKLLSHIATNPDYFHHKVESSGSCLLRGLRNEFWELLTALDVEIISSERSNEEIIPTCFEVSEAFQNIN